MVSLERTYLDYNASAPLLDCAREAMIATTATCGNASSVHFEGRNARKTVEKARGSLASLVGVEPKNIIFTSGASEAANHILSRRIRTGRRVSEIGKLYRSAIEHPCVLAGGSFDPEMIDVIPVKESGMVDTSALKSMLERDNKGLEVPMVAVMLANNETGVIQPIREIADIVRSRGGYLVVDAVQALGKVPFSMKESGAHFAFFSGHKIGGPQGSGALVLADSVVHPEALIRGGGQENRHRAGTENVAAIAGFGAACDWHLENLTKKVNISAIRDSIEEQLGTISLSAGNEIAQPVFFGKAEKRLPNTSCFSVPGINAETALVALDLEGVSVSSGSACSSGRIEASHVLRAMGVEADLARGAIRISLGWEPDQAGADRFLEAWKQITGRMA